MRLSRLQAGTPMPAKDRKGAGSVVVPWSVDMKKPAEAGFFMSS
jgi:hypothetical protein